MARQLRSEQSRRQVLDVALQLFPENLEQIGSAARDSVRQYRQYVALICVDVIEFDGTHIRKEILFNVPEPFGKESMEIMREIADILPYGILL